MDMGLQLVDYFEDFMFESYIYISYSPRILLVDILL